RNMRAGGANDILKRRHELCKNARVELEQNLLVGSKPQRVCNPPGTFIVIGSFHRDSKWSLIASTNAGTVDCIGRMSGFKPNSCAASRVTGPMTASAVPVGSR